MVQWSTVGNLVAHEVISIEWPCALVPAAASRAGSCRWALVNLGQTRTAVLATSDPDTGWQFRWAGSRALQRGRQH